MNDSNKKDDIHKNKNERNNINANNEYKNIRNNNFKFKKFYIIGGIIVLLFAIIFFNLGINLEELKRKQEKKMIFIQKTKKVGKLKKEKMMKIIMMMVLIIFLERY